MPVNLKENNYIFCYVTVQPARCGYTLRVTYQKQYILCLTKQPAKVDYIVDIIKGNLTSGCIYMTRWYEADTSLRITCLECVC